MAGFVAVMAFDGNRRVTKYALFDTKAEADAHVAEYIANYPTAFAANKPGQGVRDWKVNPNGKTLSVDPRPPEPPPPDTPERAAIKFIAELHPEPAKSQILAILG